MNKKDKIEIARTILINAANINVSQDTILKISEKLDKYIVDYYLTDGKAELDTKREKPCKKTDYIQKNRRL